MHRAAEALNAQRSHSLENSILGAGGRRKRTSSESAPLVTSHVCPDLGQGNVHDKLSSKRYYVSGLVQGVGFRYFVQRAAQHLKLRGYVRNLADGRVEVYAVGPDESLTALHQALERGPRGASVSGVADEDAALESAIPGAFEIEYDA